MLRPGEHGSTFGGNPLACAIARAALKVLVEEGMIENAARMGEYFMKALSGFKSPLVKEVRGKGLLIGVELFPEAGGARRFCEKLIDNGACSARKRTKTRSASPRPCSSGKTKSDWAIEKIQSVLAEG